MTTLTDVNEAGCPSGLAPATTGSGTDVSAFVSEKGGVKSLSLSVRGAKCAGCLSKIEGGIGAMPGVSTARLNLSSGRLDVRWSGDLDANAIAARVAVRKMTICSVMPISKP